MAIKKSELREMTVRDLEEELNSSQALSFKLRCQAVTGELENIARIKSARREVARIKTILHEKQGKEKKETKNGG